VRRLCAGAPGHGGGRACGRGSAAPCEGATVRRPATRHAQYRLRRWSHWCPIWRNVCPLAMSNAAPYVVLYIGAIPARLPRTTGPAVLSSVSVCPLLRPPRPSVACHVPHTCGLCASRGIRHARCVPRSPFRSAFRGQRQGGGGTEFASSTARRSALPFDETARAAPAARETERSAILHSMSRPMLR
jgi:hypothetical protein